MTICSSAFLTLGRAQARALAPRIDRGRNFRLAVDRAFSVPGLGTVATGTVLDGRIEVGTRLVVSPRGVEVRVRGLQSGGRAVAASREGERCALNLAGVEVGDVRRGDWLVVPAMHAPSARMLARLAVLPGAAPLRHNAPVHIHIGTADIPARVLVPGQTVIAPGGEALRSEEHTSELQSH